MLKLIMLNWSYCFFFDLFLVIGSFVPIFSIKLNLFLVSIFHVSVGWLGRFDNFKRFREDDVGVWSLLDCGECVAEPISTSTPQMNRQGNRG